MSPRLAAIAVASTALACGGGDDAPPDRCVVDDDCDGLVCTRDGACLPADEVRRVQVRWTVRGAPPGAEACADVVELTLRFADDGGGPPHQYAQVPCTLGLFTVDKLARRFDRAAIDALGAGGDTVLSGTGNIADDGTAAIDLASLASSLDAVLRNAPAR